jgi:hypothetical protein
VTVDNYDAPPFPISPDFSFIEDPEMKAATKKKIAHSLWRKHSLDWKLEPQQRFAYTKIKEAAKERNNRYVLNASRRWGKTFLLVVMAVEFALINPGCLILYVASTQKAVKDMILPAFQEIFKDAPDDLRGVLKTQTNQYVFGNGSRIKLAGCDGGRLQKLRGITAHLIIVDEAGFVDNLDTAINSVLFPMTSTTGGQMLLASNAPMSPGHDFVKIFTRQAQQTGNYLQQTIYDIPKFTQAHIDKFAESCGGYDSAAFKREYLCVFSQDEKNAVVPEWSKHKDELVKSIRGRPDFFFPLVTIDLGLVDFTGVLFGYFDFARGMVMIEDELLLKGANSEKLVTACRAKELELWGEEPPKPILRIADGQAYTLNDITTVHKYPVGAVSKDNPEAQANAIRLDVQHKRIQIHPRCVNLIGQLEDATWNTTRTSFARDTEKGHFDLIAALQYFVRHVNRHSNPFPPYYQQDVRNMRIREDKQHGASLTALKKAFTPKQESRPRYGADNMAKVFSSQPSDKKKRW